ncbi:NLP/P60 protein [Flavobacteriaceae bacterium 3519-10]|nr:NLP/P60 protein [Flavobacteriaceae bacterium 3519-10]
MEKAVCSVSVAPLRAENSHRSEMVSQLLYGETVEILETAANFTKIRMDYDQYEGWVDSKQIKSVDATHRKTTVLKRPFDTASFPEGNILLSIGSEYEVSDLIESSTPCEKLIDTALLFLNVPYLWSGRSFFGIDCSGFVQLVYKVHGFKLPRDAYQQAEHGTVLDFIEESEPGDLAFFDDSEGKIVHVGIMLADQQIIHAYGKVRIDTLDSLGLFNKDLNRHTHKLRFVKRMQRD